MQPLKVISFMEAHSVTGPAKNLLEFAQRSRQGHEGLPAVQMTIATYLRGSEGESPFIRAAREAGIEVDVIRERRRFDGTAVGRLREIVKLRNPDIVQTHNIKSHFLMRLSGLGRERVWLAFHHGYTNEDWKMRLYNATGRWSIRGATRAVTVCRPFVEQLVGQGIEEERILVRPNSVRPFERPDGATLDAVRRQIGAGSERPLVVAVGRLSQEKGHAVLVEAFGHLLEKWPELDPHLVIVGEGGERERLEQQCSRLGLTERVSLVGLKTDVSPYYALADVFVLPSYSEGSPNVLLEAMAAGCPIVTTKVGGVPETVTQEETALLVPAGEPAAMAQAMGRLLREQEYGRMLGARAKKVAETQYSPEEYSRALIRLYCQILEESKRESNA